MRPLKNMCEVAVIGGGLAGLTAARHAARMGRLVTLFEGSGLYGGQVATIHEVDGLPVPGHYSGQDLAMHLLEEARKVGVQVLETGIAKLDLEPRLTLTDESGEEHHPEAIIVASGASLRKLGVPGEEEMFGRGVSRCATCDGGFFRNQDVAVIGGGDSALQEALLLAKTSRKVIMICRSPVRAQREYIEKLAAKENVSFVWESEVSAVLGEDAVTGVRLKNLKDGTTSDVDCVGVFPFVGVAPNTDFMPAKLLTKSKHVKTNATFATSDPRIYAIGAARGDFGGLAVQAMSEAVTAADAASKLSVQQVRA